MVFDSINELTDALRRAAAAHGEHEAQIGHEDPDWPSWYAQYMGHDQARHRRSHLVGIDDSVRSQRFKHLPDRVDPRDTVASQPADPPRDPEGGRDTERDFMLRYGAADDWDIGDA